MATRQCAVIPIVLNKRGEKVESRLFKDLLSYLSNDRAEADKIYKITKSQQFIQEWNPKLTLDDNGEPTIRSMLKKTNLSTRINDAMVLKKLNREIGYYKKGMDRPALWVRNPENYKKLTDKARNFNLNSDFRDDYVARIIRIPDNESSRVFMGVRIEKRNQLNSIEADKMEYNESLNEKLRNILSSYGISIGVLTELERRMGINGVTDFDKAKSAAEGTIELIRLADGIRGEKALPEEFAHFALEAMGNSNPLVNRLINLIASNNLASEIIGEDYGTYSELYKNDEVRLAKEAAGKLLAKHLLREEAIPAKPYRNLLQRVISSIKNFFKRISANSIQRAMVQADKSFGSLARDILNGSMNDAISINNITESKTFYNTTERVSRDKKLLQDIIKNELKRFEIYEFRNPNSTFSSTQQVLINELRRKLAENNEIEGIYSYIEETLSTLKSLDSRLSELQKTSDATINEKAGVLRDIRNYLYSYMPSIDDIRDALIEEEKYEDNRYGQRVRVVIDNATTLLKDLYANYRKVATPLFVEFLRPFIGDSITIPFGKFKGKTITADDFLNVEDKDNPFNLLNIADKDISFFDRWLDSMADSSNYTIKVMDQAIKKSKDSARLRTIEDKKKIQAAAIKLEQAGIRSTEWMFEKDSKGNLTGKYISEINYTLFTKNEQKMMQELAEKYGDNPVGNDAKSYIREKKYWYIANTEISDGRRVPKKSIYGNEKFNSLSNAQKEYYNTVMEIKSRLDSYLPDNYTTLTNTIKIRKDLLERVKSSKDVLSGAKQIWEDIKDQFIRRGDDIELGDKATKKDFEGNEVQVLPIYYTKLREGESLNDMSTDVTSTLIAYAAMANDFDEMNKVIDVLELSRDLLRDNLEKVTKSKDESRIIQRLNDAFRMQVYGRYMADEGTFGKSKIDKAKTANFVNMATTLSTMALNILMGISNVATGGVMMRIEANAKEFFTSKNLIRADRNYSKELPAFLAQLGSRVKTNKLALWDELFNVRQDYEMEIRNTEFDRKSWLSRLFNSSALFFPSKAGEHWMAFRTSLSLADTYKMKSPDGNIVSLWDAMEVVYIDPSNKSLGAKLQVKQGYTKEDGSEFTKDDIFKFSRKTVAINERMHGIYNKADKNAIQRLALGRLAFLYRNWIKSSLNRRYKSATYNFDLEAGTEGYYITAGKFFLQVAKELKEGKFAITANWNNLTSSEKANMKRAFTELGYLIILAVALGLIEWSGDKDRPWIVKMTEYQARRLYTEIGAMSPGPQIFREGFKILKSPAAGVNTMENTLNMIGLINPRNYELFASEDALVKSGRYKGKSKAIRILYESPLIPIQKTIYRGLHPDESIPFLKQ